MVIVSLITQMVIASLIAPTKLMVIASLIAPVAPEHPSTNPPHYGYYEPDHSMKQYNLNYILTTPVPQMNTN